MVVFLLKVYKDRYAIFAVMVFLRMIYLEIFNVLHNNLKDIQ